MNGKQFKFLLKESIKELNEEGYFKNTIKETIKEVLQENNQSFSNLIPLNETNENNNPNLIRNASLEPRAKDIARRIVGANASLEETKMFESIFLDTAKTTLQKQLSHELRGGDYIEPSQQELQRDESQLKQFAFMDKWKQLAFSKKNK